ncbi:MAG: peptidylprolyl isomerase [Nocardioidaceae bacterium]|nr:MAG: peptidylprolyl isomerase [Nocardioidaceae bacterium]
MAAAVVFLLAACGDDDVTAEAPETGETADAAAPGRTMTTPAADACKFPAAEPAAKEVEVPPAAPPSADELAIVTDRGDITVTLDPANAPCAAGNFTWLAQHGYFDGTSCHRLVPDFVLQCGDPSGTGTGGPGYRFADELTGQETYSAGTVAMANAGPDTNGSQFFIMVADTPLDPAYTVFGKVDEAGLKLVQEISAQGNDTDGVSPKEPVTITSVS